MNAFFHRLFASDHGPTAPPHCRISPTLDLSFYRAPPVFSRRWPCVVATAIVSATVLLLEITLTRLFSVFLNYHYVFVVLAIALLGLGLGATLCAATTHWRWPGARHTLLWPLWQVCAGSGVLLIVVTVLLTQTSLASVLLAAAALALLPFLGAGLFLALVFTAEAARSRELYAADLLGAGAGCLASLPALQWLGAEHTLALAALVLLAMAVLLALTTAPPRSRSVPVCLGLLCAGMVGVMMASGLLTIRPLVLWHSNKHLSRMLDADPHARLVDSRWSALARTDVVAFSHQGQQQYAAFTDGGAATMLVPRPATPAEWEQFDRDVGLFPYRTPPRERVLIIGTGGGLDVILAQHGGAQDITAVEINPHILRAVDRFIPPARNVYRSPNVRVVRGDGRQVVRQSTQAYDLIVLQQVYTGAAQRQGGALVENYLLTTEALQDYLAHLTPQGRVVVQVHDAFEVLKTAHMSLRALAQRGNTEREALDHIVIFQAASRTSDAPLPIQAPVMILKNTPYTPAESQQQTMLMQARQFTPLFVPHMATASPLAGILRRVKQFSSQPGVLGRALRPATDNRPFFYETTADRASLTWLLLVAFLLLGGLHLWSYVRGAADKAAHLIG